MDLMDIMLERHSVREYSGEPIPEEKLQAIVRAGELAPTSRNFKPCEFHVITDKSTLAALAKAKSAGAGFVKDAAAAIVVSADPQRSDTWIEDSSIALSYMNLMAVDQGVGSCWVQMHLRRSADDTCAEANCRRILSLSDERRVVGLLALGMPK